MHVFHQSIRLFFSFFQTQTSPRRIYEEKPKPDNKIDKIDKIPPVTKKDQSVSVNNDFPIIPKPLTCDTFSQTIKRLPSIGPTDLVNIVDIPSHVVEQKLSSLGDDIDKTINLDTDENIIETENEILDIISKSSSEERDQVNQDSTFTESGNQRIFDNKPDSRNALIENLVLDKSLKTEGISENIASDIINDFPKTKHSERNVVDTQNFSENNELNETFTITQVSFDELVNNFAMGNINFDELYQYVIVHNDELAQNKDISKNKENNAYKVKDLEQQVKEASKDLTESKELISKVSFLLEASENLAAPITSTLLKESKLFSDFRYKEEPIRLDLLKKFPKDGSSNEVLKFLDQLNSREILTDEVLSNIIEVVDKQSEDFQSQQVQIHTPSLSQLETPKPDELNDQDYLFKSLVDIDVSTSDAVSMIKSFLNTSTDRTRSPGIPLNLAALRYDSYVQLSFDLHVFSY